MSVACGTPRASRWDETGTFTFPAKLTRFGVNDVPVKILLVFGLVRNMAFALFTRVG
jgi:hypothetical protein